MIDTIDSSYNTDSTRSASTELVFILDRSGSMHGLESDTIGGFNAMLAKQQAVAGRCRVTTVLFDHRYCLLHDRVDLGAVRPLTSDDYRVCGSTALLDAVGRTIRKIVDVQRHIAEPYRARHVLFVIITDGLENASREFTLHRIRTMIEHEERDYGWEFLFLGANIDAFATAAGLGIRRERTENFHADAPGIGVSFSAVATAAAGMRSAGAIPDDWATPVRGDYEGRGRGARSSKRPR